MSTDHDDAVMKLAALIQTAIGYAGGSGAVPSDEHAIMLAEPVVEALLRAAGTNQRHR